MNNIEGYLKVTIDTNEDKLLHTETKKQEEEKIRLAKQEMEEIKNNVNKIENAKCVYQKTGKETNEEFHCPYCGLKKNNDIIPISLDGTNTWYCLKCDNIFILITEEHKLVDVKKINKPVREYFEEKGIDFNELIKDYKKINKQPFQKNINELEFDFSSEEELNYIRARKRTSYNDNGEMRVINKKSKNKSYAKEYFKNHKHDHFPEDIEKIAEEKRTNQYIIKEMKEIYEKINEHQETNSNKVTECDLNDEKSFQMDYQSFTEDEDINIECIYCKSNDTMIISSTECYCNKCDKSFLIERTNHTDKFGVILYD